MPAEKKPKTSFARAGSPTAFRLVIDLTFSKGTKNEAARSEHVAPAMSRMAKRLAIMKSDKVDSAAKVAPRPIPYVAETDSPAGNEETAHVGSCEKSTKPASGEAAEIYMLLKPDLLKTWTLVPSLLMASERYSKAAKEMANTMVDSKLFALKGSNISAPTSLQLETARQKIVDLKTRLDAIQVKHESAEKKIGCYIPQIQDLEFAVSELRFVAYAKDEKEVDELQSIHVSLLEEDEQSKVGEVSTQAGAAEGEAWDIQAAKSVAATEGVATKQARVAYAAVGAGVELCKVVSHWVGSQMPYLQKQTSLRNH
ncbi:hypothetical protein FF2_045413 [Malus domestica]